MGRPRSSSALKLRAMGVLDCATCLGNHVVAGLDSESCQHCTRLADYIWAFTVHYLGSQHSQRSERGDENTLAMDAELIGARWDE
jgi:hypothetical protein